MPKPPPDPRHVEMRAVRRGELIMLPVREGAGAERVLAPSHGVYFQPIAVHGFGFFIDSKKLYDELDKTMDFK